MSFERNTRIICTVGPAVDKIESLRSLIRRGMNIARFNFSHGDHAYHGAMIEKVREASRLEGIPVALLLDTKGPEIRTGQVQGDGKIVLAKGSRVSVVSVGDAVAAGGEAAAYATPERVTVSYLGLADDAKPGIKILIADGLIALEAIEVRGRTIECVVLDGGEIGGRKNVNVVGVKTRLPALTEQDQKDLSFGAKAGMDFIAASFIRKPSDVTTILRYLAEIDSDMPVISKIEDEEGLDNVSEILRVSAGIMVARAGPGGADTGGAGPDGAEADHRPVQRGGEAGHNRDADARFDDQEPAADAR